LCHHQTAAVERLTEKGADVNAKTDVARLAKPRPCRIPVSMPSLSMPITP
jgi:hypothetical protein